MSENMNWNYYLRWYQLSLSDKNLTPGFAIIRNFHLTDINLAIKLEHPINKLLGGDVLRKIRNLNNWLVTVFKTNILSFGPSLISFRGQRFEKILVESLTFVSVSLARAVGWLFITAGAGLSLVWICDLQVTSSLSLSCLEDI